MASGKQTVFSGWVLTFRKWDRRSERRPERFPGQRRDDDRQNEDQLRRHLFELSRRSFGQKTTDHSLPRFSIVSRKKNCQQSNKFFLFTFLVKYLFHTWQWIFFFRWGQKIVGSKIHKLLISVAKFLSLESQLTDFCENFQPFTLLHIESVVYNLLALVT